MRNTYWIAMQYAIYAIAGAYLGFATQAAKTIPTERLIWTSMLVLQLLAWAMLQTQFEMFANVVYLERHLRPQVQSLLGANPCWGYEAYMANRRATGFTRFEWRYGLLGAFIVGLGVGIWLVYQAIKKMPWTPEDTGWAATNLYLGILVLGKIVQNMRLGTQLAKPNPSPLT